MYCWYLLYQSTQNPENKIMMPDPIDPQTRWWPYLCLFSPKQKIRFDCHSIKHYVSILIRRQISMCVNFKFDKKLKTSNELQLVIWAQFSPSNVLSEEQFTAQTISSMHFKYRQTYMFAVINDFAMKKAKKGSF